MDPSRLRLVRSVLFLPASNPRAIEKARGLDADMIVLDLEDAVRAADKPAARVAAVEAVKQGFSGRPVAIRVNPLTTRYFGEDVVAVRASAAHFIVLAKAETPKQVGDAAWLTGKPVLAMAETARGIIDAAAIAPVSRGLIAGTNDLSAELAIPPGAGRRGLSYALQRIVLSARAAGIAAFDGVYNRLEDEAGLEEECREGRDYGFDGKSLIHPSQIETANRIYSPGEKEVEAAQRLVEAATGGAQRFEGRMIEELHVQQARWLIARAHR